MAIVIVEPVSSGIALIDAARKLGKRAVVLSGNHGDEQARAVIRQRGAQLVRTDTNDQEQVLATVRTLAEQQPIEAVLPGMEYYVETAAYVASTFGLPCITLPVAKRMRDKYEMRSRLAEMGFAMPAFKRLDRDGASLQQIVEGIGFPAVVKPVDGCGSIGVCRVDDLRGLRRTLLELAAGDLSDVGQDIGTAWMLESYVDGPEFSLEGLITSDGPHIIAVTEKILGSEPYFVEMGHVIEADVPSATRQTLVEYTATVIAALGLPMGVFHAEVRLSRKGPVLIEAAARLGGDRICRLVELACGVSLPELMVASHTDNPLPNPQWRNGSASCVAGIRFFTAAELNIAPGSDELDTLRRQVGFQEFVTYQVPVQTDAARDFRGRIAHVIFTANSRSELDARFMRARDILRVQRVACSASPKKKAVV